MPQRNPPDVGQVVQVELIRVSVPLVHQHRSARSLESSRESVLVVLTDATGFVGLGECPAMASGGYVVETIDLAWSALCNDLAPSVLAGRPSFAVGAPAASASVADALLDLGLRSADLGLTEWLHGGVRVPDRAPMEGDDPGTTLEWCSVLADAYLETDEVLERSRAAISLGASMLKLKVIEPRRLVEQVRAIRSIADVPIAADANGSLTPADVLMVDDLSLAYLEQPLPFGTSYDQLARVTADTATPVALDESLTSLDALSDALSQGALDVASVKPARMGGLVRAAHSVDMCAERGVRAFVGGMFELGVGRAGALGLATLPGCTEPTDLGPSAAYFDTDVVEAIPTDDSGRLIVPTGPGIGRTLGYGALEEVMVDRVLLTG